MAEGNVLENKENEPPNKKRCLSLLLKERNALQRFGEVGEEDLASVSKGVVPVNTLRNNRWTLSNFGKWKKFRMSLLLSQFLKTCPPTTLNCCVSGCAASLWRHGKKMANLILPSHCTFSAAYIEYLKVTVSHLIS